MSKGINIFNHFNPPKKSDGHKITSSIEEYNLLIYCPELKDITTAHYTSIGIKCDHCKKHI